MESPHLLQERHLEIIHLIQHKILQETLSAAIQDRNLLSDRHRRILRLDQKPVVLAALVKRHHGDRIHVAAELRERLKLTILCLVYLQRAGHLLHALELSASSHTRYRYSDIHSRAESLVEQIRLKEYLTIGDRYHIGRNICRHITGLSLYYRQCCQRTSRLYLALQRCRKVIHLLRNLLLTDDLRSPLQKP